MNLVVDGGNSRMKLAVFYRNQIQRQEVVSNEEFPALIKEIFESFPGITHAILSSVGKVEKWVSDLIAVFCSVHQVGPLSNTPLKISYATPNTLGADRLALATAALTQYPRTNVLVIDAGTCVTYDMVNDYGEYLGGAISPGLQMRYKALHEFTAKLPLLEPEEVLDFIGNATHSSIHSGVINGLSLEIDGVIEQYKSRFKDLTVILTGGDAQFLSKRLKNTIFANSIFLLEGLNQLLEYNKS